MKQQLLDDLFCPATIYPKVPDAREAYVCRGDLGLAENFFGVSPLYSSSGSSEIAEGIVQCTNSACGAMYPVIYGVLVLLNEVQAYLRRHATLLLSLRSAEFALSDAMAEYIRGFEGSRMYPISPWRAYDVNGYLQSYLRAHYAYGEGLDNQIQGSYEDVHAMVEEKILPFIPGDGVALDLGCNVGGMTRRLSRHFSRVYGFDLSFRAVLAARQVLLNEPSPLKQVILFQEGDNAEAVSLPDVGAEKKGEVEIIVASALELPIKGQLDLVSMFNLIDVVPDPRLLLRRVRDRLKPGGILVEMDPYYWSEGTTLRDNWIGGKDGLSPVEQLLTFMKEWLQMEVLVGEEDGDQSVPWLLRHYNRDFVLHFNHLVVVRRRP